MQVIFRAAIVLATVPIALVSSWRPDGATSGGLSHEASLRFVEVCVLPPT